MQLATQQKWSAIIAEQQASALTIEQFCRTQCISISSFYQRKRELAALPGDMSRFVKARVTESVTVTEKTMPELIQLTLGQVNLTLPTHTSADYLAQLIMGLNT